MTVYYYLSTSTEYINAYPDENTQEGKYMILAGARAEPGATGKWRNNASTQDDLAIYYRSPRLTEQEVKKLIREHKLCKIAMKTVPPTF